jgi:glycine dehydrogenase
MPVSLTYTDRFETRHNGPSEAEIDQMLAEIGAASLDDLILQTVPGSIRAERPLDLPAALSEHELLERARYLAGKNQLFRSFIGQGYHDTVTPPVIQRNVFENPSWYTQYTPYQAEIAQGRLEALLNYQTVIIDLTGLPIANASLLDEGTAAAEAMMMFSRITKDSERTVFLVADDCHPQTIDVVRGRALPIGIEIVVAPVDSFAFDGRTLGALVQYPSTDGAIRDYSNVCDAAHAAGAYVVVAADILSLALLVPPGEFGADAAVGSTQRFGVPLGYGGPHAAYFATRDEYKRQVPGRIIGVTVDASGNPALRMALQTREQHIRRDKATSNICTAQVLLAVMAGMYAVYHGPDGLKRIAERVHGFTRVLAVGLLRLGFTLRHDAFFDTLRVDLGDRSIDDILSAARASHINLRRYEDDSVGIALDETVSREDLEALLAIFSVDSEPEFSVEDLAEQVEASYQGPLGRTSPYMEHQVFNKYRSETEMMRYLHGLASRDLSLTHSMIPLGSCTMKLNAAAELMPVSMTSFSKLHPFAPVEQAAGYKVMLDELTEWLAEITGFEAVSLQPNSGASGEYAGLLVIRAFHENRGEAHRTVCLIPDSAHGTNPASAVMAGMDVVVIRCDSHGNIDLGDLEAIAQKHAERLSALMITYPSTHGVFEENIREICDIVHRHGGQVYMDGANMNAQVGLCRPGEFGADVCHLNLHKTFAIPHGGGGPGMGPICVAGHLAPFLPGHPLVTTGGDQAIKPVSAAPYGSASILLISWAYIAMMGGDGLTKASQLAILNANYMAERLGNQFSIAYRGKNGRCAHEFILDFRTLRQATGVTEIDVAKRLMDYGYHAPTMSWPVVGTMMVEPTESESKIELDRFVDAMISIREEIREVELGTADAKKNVLKNAPHTAEMATSAEWDQPYSRQKAVFPTLATRERKFWPSVRRVDDAYGDRNLICACPPVEEYA